jgi:ABC-type multidrug transport system fused ATPase/permease subunit
MTGADVIKEYLVSLGVQVDSSAYAKLKRSLGDIDGAINKSASGWVRAFGLAGTTITGVIGAILISTVAMMRKVSDSDIVFQKFAVQMRINESAAKSLKIATDAMGQSLEDIAWNPELRSRFFSLLKDQRAMRTPLEAGGMRRELRDITHEWTRMQVVAKYGMEWITYHLGKMLGKDFKSLKDMLKSINDWLIKKMPEWTKVIATFLANVINIARSVIYVLKGVYDVLQSLWQALPQVGRAFAVFGAIVAAFFLANPLGQALMMLGMLLLMLEDYVGYTQGRPSAEFLKPLWRSVDTLLPVMKKAFTELTSVISRFFSLFEGKNILFTSFAVAIKILADAVMILADYGERAIKNMETIKKSFKDPYNVNKKDLMNVFSVIPLETAGRYAGKALQKINPETVEKLSVAAKERAAKGQPVSKFAESVLSGAGINIKDSKKGASIIEQELKAIPAGQ